MADMLVKLYDLPPIDGHLQGLKTRGIIIRRAAPYEKHIVTTWARNTFNRAWADECDVAFSRQPVACFIATDEGQVIGFACHDCTCKNFFGPTGVSPDNRGQGIGRALFLSCLHAMAQGGYAYAIIGGVGPTEFYAQTVGATIIEGSSPGIYRDRLKWEKE